MYFLDTNVIIDAIRSKNPNLKNHFMKIPSTDIGISSIVIAELEYGARHSDNYSKKILQCRIFTKDFTVFEFTKTDAENYGRIRQQLESNGTPIGPNDMLIDAVAMTNGGILVTHNTREFSRIKGLTIEDWSIS